MKNIEERFLTYVKIDTQSEEGKEQVPSTLKQFDLAKLLVEELKELGLEDARLDTEHAYVYATLPANGDKKDVPVIGFLAHMDTAPDCSGADVKPRIIRNYDGSDIALGDSGILLTPSESPELLGLLGHDLVVTDGTTLLGGDNKAGVADIMDMLTWFHDHPEVKHGTIKVGFTPDEEVGNGPEYFDVEGFGADFAYTLDGGALGQINCETFNACSVKVSAHGVQTHPGGAKDRMINAAKLLMEFDAMLPQNEIPGNTQLREGFFHLMYMEGGVSEAESHYIIRDHDSVLFAHRKEQMTKAAEELNKRYGEGRVTVEIRDSYRNMIEALGSAMHCVETAETVMRELSIEPHRDAVRGGTDGARLSFMGLPCPNMNDGDHNPHSLNEYVSLTEMKKIVELVTAIVIRYYEHPEIASR